MIMLKLQSPLRPSLSCHLYFGMGFGHERSWTQRKGNPFSGKMLANAVGMEASRKNMVDVRSEDGLWNKVPSSYLRVDPLLAGISLMPGRSEGTDPPSTQQRFNSLLIGDANRWESRAWVMSGSDIKAFRPR